MEARIRQRFSDGVVEEACTRYGIAPSGLREVGALESFVYAFEADGESRILRLSHSLRRSEALIRGELDWIRHLVAGGVSAAEPVPSEGGAFVEPIDDGQGGRFLATAFVRAAGRPPRGAWTPELCELFGRLMGRMHALTARYIPADPAWKRPEWDDPVMDYPERFLPESESIAKAKYADLCAHARTLPRSRNTYGLIHFDVHANNVHVDDAGALTIFDFDDCTYSWYINDLAIFIDHLINGAQDPESRAREVLPPLLAGYRQEHMLEARWLREIPAFLKMGEIFYYAVLHRDADPDDEELRRSLKERIEDDVPVLDLDFAAYD